MDLSVKKTLDELGVARVAKAAGIPFWTLRKWRDGDRIPGQGAAQKWRAKLFAEAVAKLRASDRSAKRKAA